MKHLLTLVVFACILLEGCAGKKEQAFNRTAAITGEGILPFDLLDAKLITSGMNVSMQRMHTLYGNEIAIQHARSKRDAQYPAGAILVEVTWKQQPDPVWFGGNIPGLPECVEVVRFTDAGNNRIETNYRYYEGNPLKGGVAGTPHIAERTAQITGERTAVMP